MIPWTAVLLAAGMSRRMGQPKLILPFAGSTVGETCIAALLSAGIGDVVVVCGNQSEGCPDTESHSEWSGRVRTVINQEPERGMFSSIRTGVLEVPPGRNFLVALADQPMVTSNAIRTLLEAFTNERPAALQPAFGGKRGHPVLFSGELREPLLAMPDGATLRDLLHRLEVTKLEMESDTVLRDIDLPEDYTRELQRLAGRSTEITGLEGELDDRTARPASG